ncbi:MAG: hypothetical protein AAF889_07900 [Cyanobacteria bacterium P01_D01_bin.73]
MFAEFRSRYPTGCLVSKMLEFTQGQYVVSVTVEQEGLVLATGLAAADTLEEAEDRARLRALEAFGLLEIDYDGSVTLLGEDQPKQISGAPSAQPLLTESRPKPPAKKSPDDRATLPQPKKSEPAKVSAASSESAAAIPALDGEIPALDFAPIALPEPSPPPALNIPQAKQPQSPPESRSTPTPEKIPASAASAANTSTDLPVDLSDAIAQITALMRQVGWDTNQGRAYLQSTYGKRSRAELTDQELMQFLGHLQTLVQKDLDF